MSAYRQILRVGDYQGDVLWEMVISAEYENLYSGECFDVDVIEFGSLKREGESRTLEQKDDEFSFKLMEFAINSDADTAISVLLRQSEYSDVWIALFAHEPTSLIPSEGGTEEFASRAVDNLLFAGLVRQKATAKDLLWIGDQWESSPSPLREWSYSAQSLGTAVLDTVNMTSKRIDANSIVRGVLDQIELSPLGRYVYEPFFYAKLRYDDAVPLDWVIRLIINKVQERLQAKIPGLEIELVPGESGFAWAGSVVDMEDIGETVHILQDGTAMFGGLWIDRKLIKPLRTDDGIGVDGRDSVSWHRFESVTEWLYAMAVALGNQVIVRMEGTKKITIEFRRVVSTGLGNIQIIDADTASLDIQSDKISDSDKYYCQATSINKEGYSENYKDAFGYIKSDDKIPSAAKPLPVSVSVTMQKIPKSDFKGENYELRLLQNCRADSNSGMPSTWDGLSTLPMAWTGLMYGFAGAEIINRFRVLSAIMGVCSPIGNAPRWYDTLSECLNNRISEQSNIYTSDYKITVPYVKGFRVEGGEPSIFALDLFGRVVLDGKEFVIVGYEIKPIDGEVDITLSRISRYAYFEPEAPSGKIEPPRDGGEDELLRPIIGGLTAGEAIDTGDMVMIASDGTVMKYKPIELNYGRYYGISTANCAVGDNVPVRNSGIQASSEAIAPGKPVYARMTEETTPNPSEGGELRSKAVSSSLRLHERSDTEQIDICIGYAISEYSWILDKRNEFIIE